MSHLRRLRSEGMPPPPHTTWVTFSPVRLQNTFPAPNSPIPVSHKYRRHSQKGVNGLLADVAGCFVDQLGSWNVAWLSDRSFGSEWEQCERRRDTGSCRLELPHKTKKRHDLRAHAGQPALVYNCCLPRTRRSEESACNIPGDLASSIIYGGHQRVFGSPFR